jgi:hypothetical protein
MANESRLALELLPGTQALLAAHSRELPQRDDLCGAFCGSLALHAAQIAWRTGQPLDQDTVALAAGTLVSDQPEPSNLPRGEHSRRDYRLKLPTTEDASVSGTTAAGVVQAIEELSEGALAAVPYADGWSVPALAGLFDLLVSLERPVTLVANLATRQLWGARAAAAQLLDYLFDGSLEGPPPDWDVGHFSCIIGRLEGPRGSLYGIADTYPALGSGGVHAQPAERLVRALQRPGMPAGGLLAVLACEDAPRLRAAAPALGLREGDWDNGTAAIRADT